MSLIDIGVNLTNSRLYHDREYHKQEAISAGVIHQIITGTSYETSLKALSICEEDPSYYSATAGCHPHDAKDFTTEHLQGIQSLIEHECVIAIGECGLDFNRNFSAPDIQCDVFEQQINLALETDMPLFLHQRDAHTKFMEHLTPHADSVRGVCHCFTEGKDEMRDYLDLGFYIGITGWLCDERRGKLLQEALRYLPLDRLLFETDAPYLLPRTIRPRPKSNMNIPSYLPWVVKTAEEITGVSAQELSEISTQNCHTLFTLAR